MFRICTRSRMFAAGAVTVGLAFATIQVRAGGAKIPNQSTRAMGMSDAFVGGADDASAVYYNPAGLIRLKSAEWIGNLYFARSEIDYSGRDGNDTSDGRLYTIPVLYLAAPLGEDGRTAVGLGIYSPYGLGSRWGDDVVERWAAALPPMGAAQKFT